MKRFFFILTIVIVLFIGIYSIILFINREIDIDVFDFNREDLYDDSEMYVEFPITVNELKNEIVTEGEITSSDDVLEIVTIRNYLKTEVDVLKKVGEFVFEKEELYKQAQSVIQSKVNGYISSIIPDGNDLVITVMKIDDLFVNILLLEEEFGTVNATNDVELMMGKKEYKGEIVSIGYEAVDGLIPVRIQFKDDVPIKEYKAIGSKVRVTIDKGMKKDIYTVTKDAISVSDVGYHVKIRKKNGEVIEVPVEIGIVTEDEVEIISDRLSNELIIIKYLYDGTKFGDLHEN